MNNGEIKQVIQEFFDKLDVQVQSIEEIVDENSFIFSIKAPEERGLAEEEKMMATNHLVSRIVQKKYPETARFKIDINDYYQKVLEVIRQKARFAADRARSYKVDIEMEPMNSYERLIVHSMFPEGGDIKTHSTGSDADRRVVLSFVEKQ